MQSIVSELLRAFFAIDDPAFLTSVGDDLVRVELPAGAVLFRQGEISADVYFVIQGRLRVLAAEPGETTPKVIGDVARGETLGELAFLSGAPRSATIIALRESMLIRMSRERFEQVLNQHPHVALTVMRTMAQRYRRPAGRPRRVVPPQILTIVPISTTIDAAGFAARLREERAALGDPTVLLTAGDGATLGATLATIEQERGTAILLTDGNATAWSRTCIAHADEVLLLADASAAPEIVPIERSLLGEDQPVHADRTLVLLHPPTARSPADTARWLDARKVKRHLHLRHGHARDMRRLTRLVSGRGIGLVLSGGGARGLAHVGVLDVLDQAGIEIDVVGGTSIGAVFASWYAMDVRGNDLRAAARKAFVTSGNPIGDYNLLPLVSMVRGTRVRRLIENAIETAMGHQIGIEDCWISYFCITADYAAATPSVRHRGSLAKSMLASIALPGALPPIVLDRHLHIDGGTLNNMPVDVMETLGVATIVAVDLLADTVRTVPFDWVPSPTALLWHRLQRLFRRQRRLMPGIIEIMLKASLLHSIDHQRDQRNRADVTITPALQGVRLLDWKKFDIADTAGAEATRQQLAALDEATLARLRARCGNPTG
ncbi:patatin-like phospholipase family protein [Acidiphilium sp.]|uniref:patatin-like phospholipase family protein n=1 Tax=Acidiphilium sp. TaxID=527 RepID=UPI003D01FCF1